MLVLLLIYIVNFPPLVAQEIEAYKVGHVKTFVKVKKIPLPSEYLNKSLSSGLSTNILFRVLLEKDSRTIYIYNQAIKVYLDLWDEVYYLNATKGNKLVKEKFGTKEKLMERMSKIRFSGDNIEINSGENITIKFETVIDPISKEKVKKIRKWLSQNTVNSPATGSTSSTLNNTSSSVNSSSNLSAPSGGITSGAVFRGAMESIFESELQNGAKAGGWINKVSKVVNVGESNAK